MVQLIHDQANQIVRLYIADYSSDHDITVILTNIETRHATSQNVQATLHNGRYTQFALDVSRHDVGMYLMDLSQPQIELGRHLLYLSYDGDDPIKPRPYDTYTTEPSEDVVYDG